MRPEQLIRGMLKYIGENPDREGLGGTPERVVKSWGKLFGGYYEKAEDVLETVFVEGACDEMVILKNIEFYSMCEHHILPYSGSISLGYIPSNKVVGVSKIARLVEIYSRRLQIQEKMTTQIADDFNDVVKPQGVMVVCKAKHLCMTARGVEKQSSEMITSAVRGLFKEDAKVRAEFFELLKF